MSAIASAFGLAMTTKMVLMRWVLILMNKKTKEIILFVVGGIFLIILLQNTHVVTFHILFWNLSMSLIILQLLILFLGLSVGYFWGKCR